MNQTKHGIISLCFPADFDKRKLEESIANETEISWLLVVCVKLAIKDELMTIVPSTDRF